MPSPRPRRIVLATFPGAQILDVTGPLEVFSTANKDTHDYNANTTVPLAGDAFVVTPAENADNLEGQLVTGLPANGGFVWLPAGN